MGTCAVEEAASRAYDGFMDVPFAMVANYLQVAVFTTMVETLVRLAWFTLFAKGGRLHSRGECVQKIMLSTASVGSRGRRESHGDLDVRCKF